MQILVVDVGGTEVKILVTGEKNHRQFVSSSSLTAKQMVAGVLKAAEGWKYEAISIGYPGPVLNGRPVAEPFNLGTGWVGFDFEAALNCPVKVLNDAAMQALGSYRGGKMLFLGLGIGGPDRSFGGKPVYPRLRRFVGASHVGIVGRDVSKSSEGRHLPCVGRPTGPRILP
jgi:predicted NBD/HSP70 family sugar kinase